MHYVTLTFVTILLHCRKSMEQWFNYSDSIYKSQLMHLLRNWTRTS